MIVKRVALGILAGGSPVLLVAFLFGGPLAEWVFALTSVLFPPALIAIGVARREGLGGLGPPLAILSLLLLGSAAGIMILSPAPAGVGVILGLPPAALLLFVGLGLLPLTLVSWAHATFFRRPPGRPSE